MSLADFMLPQISPESARLSELRDITPPSNLFAGYDPETSQLLIDGVLKDGVEELTPEHLTTNYKSHRNLQFIESLPYAPKQRVLWDMEDARAFDSQVYTGKNLHIFQYNRRIGSRHGVFWRLRSYFEPSRGIGHAGAVEDNLDFDEKKPLVYWRGAMSGSRWADPFRRVGVLSIDSAADFEAVAHHFSRIKAVLLSKETESFDFKLSGPGTILESKPWLNGLGVIGDAVRPAQQLENRYILCLNGNDVASNLYWVLSSQSVAFKEDCSYEVLPDYFIKPWVHYVPIASGLTDLQEKFDYCQANADLCKRIINNANEAYNRMIDMTTWNNAEFDVLERLRVL